MAAGEGVDGNNKVKDGNTLALPFGAFLLTNSKRFFNKSFFAIDGFKLFILLIQILYLLRKIIGQSWKIKFQWGMI